MFLQGTTIMHAAARGSSRSERVRQSKERLPSVRDVGSYVPVGDAPSKLRRWSDQGATILYLSSHRRSEDVALDERVLRGHGFPPGEVLYRRPTEAYADTVVRARPDVLIEDDCESIGGAPQMASTYLEEATRARVRVHVVPEFGGIDHLPDTVTDLTGGPGLRRRRARTETDDPWRRPTVYRAGTGGGRRDG